MDTAGGVIEAALLPDNSIGDKRQVNMQPGEMGSVPNAYLKTSSGLVLREANLGGRKRTTKEPQNPKQTELQWGNQPLSASNNHLGNDQDARGSAPEQCATC
jgi:hypothetical protein